LGCSFQIEVYEGPLEFLYELIKKHKIDICDVPIYEITSQFNEYVKELKSFDIELASDFIVMAAELLEIKSRYLLYLRQEEDEAEDPRKDLVERLLVYNKFKQAGEHLKEKSTGLGERFCRKQEEVLLDEEFQIEDMSIESLMAAMAQIPQRAQVEEPDLMQRTYRKKSFTMEEKTKLILEKINESEDVAFEDIIFTGSSEEKIVAFLSALELVKKKFIKLCQSGFAMPITIQRRVAYEI
jgi:Uncharacterized conserved protein